MGEAVRLLREGTEELSSHTHADPVIFNSFHYISYLIVNLMILALYYPDILVHRSLYAWRHSFYAKSRFS